MDLNSNRLEALPFGVFNHLHNLKLLDLAYNKMRQLPSEALAPLKWLKTLYFSYNTLETCTVGKQFANLTSLTQFGFDNNNNRLNCANNTFRYLPKQLQSLSFVLSADAGLENGIFHHLHSVDLKELLLAAPKYPDVLSSLDCQMTTINFQDHTNFGTLLNPSTFETLSRINSSLMALVMQKPGNVVSIVGAAFRRFHKLKELGIHSSLQYISTDAFEGLPYLQVLDLSYNFLNLGEANAAMLFSNMMSLESLDLGFNSFDHIFKLDTLWNLTSLKYLNLTNNEIYSLECELNCPTNLREINFSYMYDDNKSKKICMNQTFPFLTTFNIQQTKSNFVKFTFPICDFAPNLRHCMMFNVIPDYAPYWPFASLLQTALGKRCNYLEDLDISQSTGGFLTDKQFDIFLPNLKKLNIARNILPSLTNLSFIKSANLNWLIAKDNMLGSFEMIPLFDNLTHLDMNGNKIDQLEEIIHLDTLQRLNVSRNLIRNISKAEIDKLQDLSLNTLDISDNPFDCTCDILHFKKWILSDDVTFVLDQAIRCQSPATLTGNSVTSVNLYCTSHLVTYIAVFMSIGLFVCLLTILVVRFRWHIKYKLFLLLRDWRRRKYQNMVEDEFADIDDDDDDNIGINWPRAYHAYVSYDENSEVDEGWVINELRINIEEGPERFRLCIKARDFIPGDGIIDSITDNIQKSLRTILVLSPRFVESEWCYYETQMARMRLFHENRDVLTLVMLENIPDFQMTMSLRQLLCKKDFLKYPNDKAGQDLFWQRLREELKTPVRVDRRNEP